MKILNRNLKRVALAGIGATLLAGAMSSAVAGTDGKSYPGWMCQPENSDKARWIIYETNGGVSSYSNSGITLICPILRDRLGVDDGSGIKSASIYYTDNNHLKRIDCSISALNASRPTKTAYGSSPVYLKKRARMDLTGPNEVAGPITTNTTYYAMKCKLPGRTGFGRSILHSYTIVEKS